MRKTLWLISAVLVIGIVLVGCQSDPAPTQSAFVKQTPTLSLQGIPSTATIDSAEFFFYVDESASQAVTIHRITAAWTESGVTWNSLGSNFDTATAGTFTVSDTGWVSVDVTDLAKGWFDSTIQNYGILLDPAAADTSMVEYASRQASENKPYLKICYTAGNGAECEAFIATMDAYISEEHPDSNFGAEDYLETGRDTSANSTVRTVVQADFEVVIPPSTIEGRVWDDLNDNGIQDEGEMGIEGIAVRLFVCNDSGITASTMTDTAGRYEFDSVMTGEYYVEVVPPNHWVFSPMDQGDIDSVDSDVNPTTGETDCFMLDPGVTVTFDAGLFAPPATVGDFVWNDENMNGIQDEGEPGLEGITVTLYSCNDSMVATTTTDMMGLYHFDMLTPGDYYLAFVNPFGWIFTYADQGTNDSLDSDVNRYTKRTVCFSLYAGQVDDTWDAGLFRFEGCTRSKGYWKNHAGFGPQPNVLTPLLLPLWLGTENGLRSIEVADSARAYAILTQKVYGDPSNGITKLYAQLLTAKLNIVAFANPEVVYEDIQAADSFLAMYDWNDWGTLSKEDRKFVMQWQGKFDEYNNGIIGPGYCGDDDDEHDGDLDEGHGDEDNGGDWGYSKPVRMF